MAANLFEVNVLVVHKESLLIFSCETVIPDQLISLLREIWGFDRLSLV